MNAFHLENLFISQPFGNLYDISIVNVSVCGLSFFIKLAQNIGDLD